MDNHDDDIAWLRSSFRPLPRPALPDDCIEYTLHIFDADSVVRSQAEIRAELREVQKKAAHLQRQWLKDYIWQRESFTLELVNENDLSFLRGRTEYGDSIEDEWVVVWLLRELTRTFPNLWVKVSDSDGEFLLIEASATLPPWLEPEVADNRVWINNGQLKIIKPGSGSKSQKHTTETLTLANAKLVIRQEPRRIMHSVSIEEEAFYRLRNYPGQIESNMHHAVLKVPRKVAFLLLQKPAYVAPAVEAFYLRDPIALKSLQGKSPDSKLIFPPTDLVQLSIKLPRPAYAQLRCQDFPVLDNWKSCISTGTGSPEMVESEVGMKLTCGFEMLLSDKHYQDRPMVREMHLLLEDIVSEDAHLPSDVELAKLEKRRDKEDWMDISMDDLQAEIRSSEKTASQAQGKKKPEFGDRAAQENLQRIVKQFEAFLNADSEQDPSGLFGDGDDSDTDELDDIDSDDLDEDKEASFAEADFEKVMQEMMGLPPEAMAEIRRGNIDALTNGAEPRKPRRSGSEPSRDGGKTDTTGENESDSDVEGLRNAMDDMGRELSALGALDLSAPESDRYKKIAGKSRALDNDESDNENDAALVRNMLEAFRSQNGGAGPASNIMALLAEQDDQVDPSRSKGKGSAKTRLHPAMVEDVD